MRIFIIGVLLFMFGCATGVTGLMRLQDRELLIHPDKPGLAYPHKIEVCEYRNKRLKFLGKKCKDKQVIDFYDFTKKSVRDQLRAAGFSCESDMRFKY